MASLDQELTRFVEPIDDDKRFTNDSETDQAPVGLVPFTKGLIPTPFRKASEVRNDWLRSGTWWIGWTRV